jgi:hypothetical protein
LGVDRLDYLDYIYSQQAITTQNPGGTNMKHYAIPTPYGWATRSTGTTYSHVSIRDKEGNGKPCMCFHKSRKAAHSGNGLNVFGVVEIDPQEHLVSAKRIKEIKANENCLTM